MRGNFRVWDNKDKKYDYGDFLITTDGELLKDVGSYSVEVWRCEHNEPGRYVAEFSTGLKSKDGDEIHEGDIVVAWSVGHRAVGEVKKRIDGLWLMYPAYQHGKQWGLCPNPKGETTVEIIGNIHENPELLERR